MADRNYRQDDESKDHEKSLDHVCKRDGQEASQCCVDKDDDSREQDTAQFTYLKARAEGLSSSQKLSGHVRDHEDQDDEDRDNPQDIGFILEARFEKVWKRQIIHHRRVAPQPFSDEGEEEDFGCDVAGHSPNSRRTDHEGHPGDTDEEPGRAAGNDCTQSHDKLLELPASEEKLRKAG